MQVGIMECITFVTRICNAGQKIKPCHPWSRYRQDIVNYFELNRRLMIVTVSHGLTILGTLNSVKLTVQAEP